MNNPFIPLGDSNTVIIAGNISEEIYKNLKKLKLRVIKTIAHKKVDSSIKYHPDIVMHPINNNTLVIEPSVYDYYKDEFKDTNIKIIKGEKSLDSKYPLDIAYNVGRIGTLAVHNFQHTDKVLKHYLKRSNLELINVNQGYTKCSMAIVGERDIITSDNFIDKVLKEHGINSLLIKSGHIFLENQNYGFIGGCTGNISNREVVFSGSLDMHPEKTRIEDFIYSLNKEIVYLSKETINDIGTIIALNLNS